MGAILDEHRIDKSRTHKPELLTLAQTQGKIIKPNPWDIIVFDAATPHLPVGMLQQGQRILQSAWIEMELPRDWETRARKGDVPQLRL
jgi:hypothetical protein